MGMCSRMHPWALVQDPIDRRPAQTGCVGNFTYLYTSLHIHGIVALVCGAIQCSYYVKLIIRQTRLAQFPVV